MIPVQGINEIDYAAGILSVMVHYPEDVVERVVDPFTGIPSKQTFRPSIHELRRYLDDEMRPIRAERDRKLRENRQLRERAAVAIEGEPRERRKTMVEIENECAAQGIFFESWRRRNPTLMGPGGKFHGETPQTVQAKLGLSQAEWEAMP